MKFLAFVVVLLLSVGVISCKKEKTADTNEARFMGLWVESSTKKDTLLVTQGERNGIAGPMMLLYANSGSAIPFNFNFNATEDSITITDLTLPAAEDRTAIYKITFDQKTFSIKRFHTSLPDVDPVVFNRVR